MIASVCEALNCTGSIAITTHARPDGDALGSSLGLMRLLRDRGRSVTCVDIAPIAHRYQFLLQDGELVDSASTDPAAFETLVVLDCGGLDRAPEPMHDWARQLHTINIDHHQANTVFGDTNWIDTRASSVGEMIVQLATASNWSISDKAAIALWVAMITDTGRFAYENTTSDTLHAAARLLEADVPTARINQSLFTSTSIKHLTVEARAMASLASTDGLPVAWIELTRNDFEQLDADTSYVEDLVNIPRRIEGNQVALFFCEIPGDVVTKVSVRTTPAIDAAALCRRHGGGGHPRAAGCTIQGDASHARAAILESLKACFTDAP